VRKEKVNNMVIIEPSILSADFARLGEQAQEVEAAGLQIIQIDVMDGNFVPNLTFGPDVVKALRSVVKMKLDVHLMIVEPQRYLHQFVDAGADRLIVHQEACLHLHDTLQTIRKLGVQVGVTLNPGTPIQALEEVLALVDVVQVMTVNPGFGGQAFIQSQLSKIRRLKQMIENQKLTTPIAVDGGIDVNTSSLVVEAGATILVAGSSVFNRDASVVQNIAALYASIEKEK
jgi:ribulose-phosphate 3-epimerase